jgi:hypothetical protein
MARTGIYALIDEIKNAASPDEASGRIDRFVVDLGEDAKHYGWPQGKIATQQARLRKLIKATVREEKGGTPMRIADTSGMTVSRKMHESMGAQSI